MSERKWTPGPWTTGLDSGQWFVADQNGELVATVCEWSTALDQADAHLIAAAPEMYEALDALAYHPAHQDTAMGRRARDILAKARGEA